MSEKMIIISLDAMGADDLTADKLKWLPNLANLIRTGTHVKTVEPILPTLTYPSHTSIITGTYPNKHGIINNVKLESLRQSPDWYWYRKAVQVKPLYDIAKEAGLTTAAFLWPVTARAKIDYNIAEIFPNRFWNNQIMVSLWASSPLFAIQMNTKFGYLRRGIRQPYLDNFITAAAVDTIKHKRPDLTMIHLVDMDAHRHRYGVRSKEAYQALKRLDLRVGQIIQATKDAHTFANTTFAILGDHYQIDVTHMIRLNSLFREKGWLQLSPDGLVDSDWQVFANSCDGTTYVYTRPGFDKTSELFEILQNRPEIDHVYTQQEAAEKGADPKCTFMCDAKSGYYFINNATGSIIETVTADQIGRPDRYRAVHGYAPDKPDYQTTLILNGPKIKAGQAIPKAKLVDEAPTFAKIMGLTMPDTIDGKPIEAAIL
ncbi:alkaline phosphatase family protein [Lactobacillus sp. CC-MHH1034]|uniref:alkaline phosphatase family protein n=1 Tax=Agrilactobacillus fermenti TaxID=2586909 RepID=UPI001E3AB325|nr:ectonucleotide pyrophosphatase/phosphodiesterase [Agrilactobacillus fermenti]MCD2256576.1 alkaline phosphatase family protein [Agrilactobacillus fermenti]